MKRFVRIAIVLALSGAILTWHTEADDLDSLCNIEYCVPFNSIEEYLDQTGEFALQIQEFLKEAKSKKRRPEALLHIAQLFEGNLGYCETTFDLYNQVVATSGDSKRHREFAAAAMGALSRLADQKFKVLASQLADPSLRRADWEIVIVPRFRYPTYQKFVVERLIEGEDRVREMQESMLRSRGEFLRISERAKLAKEGRLSEVDELEFQLSRAEARARQELDDRIRSNIAEHRRKLKLPRLKSIQGEYLVAPKGAVDDGRFGRDDFVAVVLVPRNLELHWKSREAGKEIRASTPLFSDKALQSDRVELVDWWLERDIESVDFYSLSERLGILNRFLARFPDESDHANRWDGDHET